MEGYIMNFITKISLNVLLAFLCVSTQTFSMDKENICNVPLTDFRKMRHKNFSELFTKCSQSNYNLQWFNELLRRKKVQKKKLKLTKTKQEYNSYYTLGSYIYGSALFLGNLTMITACPLIVTETTKNMKNLSKQEETNVNILGITACEGLTAAIFGDTMLSRKSRINNLKIATQRLEQEIAQEDLLGDIIEEK